MHSVCRPQVFIWLFGGPWLRTDSPKVPWANTRNNVGVYLSFFPGYLSSYLAYSVLTEPLPDFGVHGGE